MVTEVVTDEAEDAKTYAFSPTGHNTGSSDTVDQPWGYAGQYRIASGGQTQLYKMGIRFYAPEHSVWTQQDPLGVPTDPTQMNRYTYVGGDPINRIDPSGAGLQEAIDYAITGGGVGFGIGATIGCVTGGIGGAIGGSVLYPGLGTAAGVIGGCVTVGARVGGHFGVVGAVGGAIYGAVQ